MGEPRTPRLSAERDIETLRWAIARSKNHEEATAALERVRERAERLERELARGGRVSRPDLEFYVKQGDGAVHRLAAHALELEARLGGAAEALRRLSSGATFTVALDLEHSAKRAIANELRERMRYAEAEAALAEQEKEQG